MTFFQRRFIDKRYGWDADLASKIGLAGVSKTAFPNFAIPGYVALSAPPGRIQTPIRDTQFLDALSWFKGSHSVKAGFEFRRAGNSEIRDRGSSGIFQFVPQYTSLPGISGTGDGVASFLRAVRTRAAYRSPIRSGRAPPTSPGTYKTTGASPTGLPSTWASAGKRNYRGAPSATRRIRSIPHASIP